MPHPDTFGAPQLPVIPAHCVRLVAMEIVPSHTSCYKDSTNPDARPIILREKPGEIILRLEVEPGRDDEAQLGRDLFDILAAGGVYVPGK